MTKSKAPTKKPTKQPTQKATTTKSATLQAENSSKQRDSKGRFIKGNTPVVGFHTDPDKRSSGGWSGKNKISYWYNYFLSLTADEVRYWADTTPEKKRSMAQEIAYARALDARKNNRLGLENTREITDRTEGKAPQVVTNLVRQSPLDNLNLSREELLAIAFGTDND